MMMRPMGAIGLQARRPHAGPLCDKTPHVTSTAEKGDPQLAT